jgi:uncharacterized membrane protein
MRKTPLLLLLAFCFSNCSETPKPTASQLQSSIPNPQPTTLRGYYVLGDEVSMFRNCADNKQYWVQDETSSLDSLYQLACLPAPIPYEAAYAVLTGTLGPKDTVGFAAETDGVFVVRKVDTLQSKNRFNACLAWEFWCSGTEPFWSLQISEAEGGIFFKNMADETGAQYTWDEPQTDGSASWVYETSGAPGGKDRLKIVIKKEKCNDGMSEIEYGYSVVVTQESATLRGCAVRGGEPMKRE